MADASFKYSKRRRRSLARRRKQWEGDAYNPLTPFPNSEACQLSWSARWFSKFEARVMSSIPACTSFAFFFSSLHIFNYFLFSFYFNIFTLFNFFSIFLFMHLKIKKNYFSFYSIFIKCLFNL